MSKLEADTLPVGKETSRHRVPEVLARPDGADMNAQTIPGVLMLRCSALSHHAVRETARRAGLAVRVELAENRREFLEELRQGSTDLIIADPAGLPDLDLDEILERARRGQPSIPVMLAGGPSTETETMRVQRQGATEILPPGELERLPAAMLRALKVRELAKAQARQQIELDRAASMLRENQKLVTIGRLAASIAHEINNPLESITNLLYLMGEERDLSSTAQGYLALAQRELERVAQISRQTLNFSRETTGPVRAHIDELLEEVLSLYGRRIMEKNIQVQRQYDCPEEAIVYPGEMRQVLSNLVTNAVEASSLNGRLRLRVRCTRSWSDPGVRGIRVSIGDNGSGIEPAVQERLGEPFFTTKGQRGTGLGLWVTRSIVQRYGGEIQLRSSVAPNRHGTVFSIFLPTNMRPQMVDRLQDSDSGSGGKDPAAFPKGSSGPIHRSSAQDFRQRRMGGR